METADKKEFTQDISVLKPENLLFRIVAARRQRVEDSYKQGKIGAENYEEIEFDRKQVHRSVPGMFVDTFGNLPRKGPDPEHIGTMDNNIYVDVKGGSPRVVDARGARGVYRVTTDRMETSRGHTPSDEVIEKWKKGEGKLYTGRYEIEFTILIGSLEEDVLAKLCGINNW